ncbi:hypothetical protein [Hyalangium minutum]|uniref:Uncharacterized protein n=1 Tax=Hyalangium minutum TaxID=394096 RepID=A0A085WAS5_9BACT|nr:hypothetical protein [Hyalangium minutum]KFE64788.1 hypothetical protein DB31_1806 [Hyalangium minutum]
MGKEHRAGPVEVLRNLALSLERMAAREAASSVMRGAAEGIREELPDELERQLHALLQDALTVLGRMAHEAAEREPVEPGATAHTLAAAAMQGVVEVLEREWQDGGMPFHALVERINRLLDEITSFARSRTDEIRTPGERAQAMAEGMVRAAVRELQESLPRLKSKLREDGALLGSLFEQAGRGLARGLAAGLREELASGKAVGSSLEELAGRSSAAVVRGASGALKEQAGPWRQAVERDGTLRRASREVTAGVLEALGARLRRPLLALMGAGGALVGLSLFAARWRRA